MPHRKAVKGFCKWRTKLFKPFPRSYFPPFFNTKVTIIFFCAEKKNYIYLNWFSKKRLINNVLQWTWMNSNILPASAVLRLISNGLDAYGLWLGAVQPICYAWLFDEGTGTKSQECAGIQILCEHIMPSITPPHGCTSGLACRTVTGVGFAAPSASVQPALLKPTEGPTPHLLCQLSLL